MNHFGMIRWHLFFLILCCATQQGMGQLLWERYFEDMGVEIQAVRPLPEPNTYAMLGIKDGQPYTLSLDNKQNVLANNSFVKEVPFQSSLVYTNNDKNYWLLSHQSKDTVRLIKANLLGNVIAETRFQPTATIHGFVVNHLQQVVVVGQRRHDMFIGCYTMQGGLVWERSFGGGGLDALVSVVTTKDGGYLACGYTDMFNSGETDMMIVQLDSNGRNVWEKVLGDPAYYERGCLVQVIPESGHIVIVGTADKALWLVRINEKLNVVRHEFIENKERTLQPLAFWVNAQGECILALAATPIAAAASRQLGIMGFVLKGEQ